MAPGAKQALARERSKFGRWSGKERALEEYKRYLDHLWQRRVTIAFSNGVAIFSGIMFLSRAYFEGFKHPSIYLNLGASILFILGTLYAKKTHNYRPIALLISLSAFMILPIRAAATGGMQSLVVLWFALLPPVAVVILGIWQSVLLTLLTLGHLILILYYPHWPIKVPIQLSSDTAQLTVAVVGLSLSLAIAIMYELNRKGLNNLLIKSYNKLEESSAYRLRVEQLETAQRMVKTYNHEINNPLQIAIGNLSLYRRKGDEKSLEKIEESIRRIDEITQKISASVDQERLQFNSEKKR